MPRILDETKNELRRDNPVVPREFGTNFARGLLEDSHLKQPSRSLDILISLASQIAFVVLAVLLPLCFTQVFNLPEFQKTMLVMPPPPPPPPWQSEVRTVVKPKVSLFNNGKLVAPRVIPEHVEILKESQQSAGLAGVAGGVPGGVRGGTIGGVLGGILSSRSIPAAPAPPKPLKNTKPLRVGGRVEAPRPILEVQPTYPTLARETRTQGDVVLDCVIDEHGNVTQMKLVSGIPLLVPSAIAAVRQWKYQPTLLNGTPVAVEMEVNVKFSMGS